MEAEAYAHRILAWSGPRLPILDRTDAATGGLVGGLLTVGGDQTVDGSTEAGQGQGALAAVGNGEKTVSGLAGLPALPVKRATAAELDALVPGLGRIIDSANAGRGGDGGPGVGGNGGHGGLNVGGVGNTGAAAGGVGGDGVGGNGGRGGNKNGGGKVVVGNGRHHSGLASNIDNGGAGGNGGPGIGGNGGNGGINVGGVGNTGAAAGGAGGNGVGGNGGRGGDKNGGGGVRHVDRTASATNTNNGGRGGDGGPGVGGNAGNGGINIGGVGNTGAAAGGNGGNGVGGNGGRGGDRNGGGCPRCKPSVRITCREVVLVRGHRTRTQHLPCSTHTV